MSAGRLSPKRELDRLTQGGCDGPRLRGDIRYAHSAETPSLSIAHIDDRYPRRWSLSEATGRVAQDCSGEAQEAPVPRLTKPVYEDHLFPAAGPLSPVILNHDTARVRVRLRHDVGCGHRLHRASDGLDFGSWISTQGSWMQRDYHDRRPQRTTELLFEYAPGREIGPVQVVQPRCPHYDHRARIFSHLADTSGVHLVAHEVQMAQFRDGVPHDIVDRAFRFLATGQVDDGNRGDGCGKSRCQRLRSVAH